MTNDSNKSPENNERSHRSVTLRLPTDIHENIRKLASQHWVSVSKILVEGLDTFIKDNFIEKSKQEEVWEIIWDLKIEELQWEVLKFLETNPREFASWTEAKIYKMHIPWKQEDVLVVKRKYKWTSLEEFDIHSKAKEIEFLLKQKWIDNNVHIPALFHHFNKDGEEYILMEYIKWKTLYLMIIESILKNETIKYWEKIKDIESQKDFYHIFYTMLKNQKLWDLTREDFDKLDIKDIKKILWNDEWYLEELDIETDEDGENILKYLYWLLKEQWVLNINIDSIKDMWWLKINKFLFDIVNREDFKWLWFLSTTQALFLSKNLWQFLREMHDNWLYHRDIWNNTRNIILTQSENWLYIPTIIDFWKSVIVDKNLSDNEVYIEENADSTSTRYANDEMIINRYIDKLSTVDEKPYRLVDKQKENSLEKLMLIWEKYWVFTEDLKSAFNFISWYKNVIFFDKLKNILNSRKVAWWYELNLSKTNNKEKFNERVIDKSKILSEIIVLMFFTREQNFEKILYYIEKLDNDKSFNPPRKKEYIELYKNIFEDIWRIRKED